MMKKYYTFSKELNIYIYGVNQYSKNVKTKLQEVGLSVGAFIDRRARELQDIDGVPVISPQTDVLSKIKRDSCCVIIMLQNALQHDGIAEELFLKGIEKIIFVPMKRKYNIQIMYEMIEVYNSILLEPYSCFQEIPYYRELLNEEATIEKETEYIIKRVPADILYSNPVSNLKNDPNILKYADAPIMSYKPYYDMLEYFEGGEREGDLEEYLKDYGVNSCNYKHAFSNEMIILQRYELYKIWNEHFQQGMDFFCASAPAVCWNEKGYFNLLEGQHRSLFLVKKGIYFVPVRIHKSDLAKWESEINKVGSNDISLIETAIFIQKNLPRKLVFGERILCSNICGGYFETLYRKMGALEVATFLPSEGGLSKQLDWLDKYSFVSFVGNGDQIAKEIKQILLKFKDIPIKGLLFSMSSEEVKELDDTIQRKLTRISKIFLDSQMLGIYLLKR